MWVSTQPVGLTVGGSRVSFSFHHHRASDGRWIPSAWDAAHVRPVGGFLTIAPLDSLRDIEQVILPAIADGLAKLPPAGQSAAPAEERPTGRATGRAGGSKGEPGGPEPGHDRHLARLSAISLWLITVILALPLAALFGSLILFGVFELIVLVDMPPYPFTLGGVLVLLAAGLAGQGRAVALSRRMARSQRVHGLLRPGPSTWCRTVLGRYPTAQCGEPVGFRRQRSTPET